MPVTVTSGEKGFSNLKIIKTHWRWRWKISHERLNNLEMFFIENDIGKTIPLKNILRKFANKNTEK